MNVSDPASDDSLAVTRGLAAEHYEQAAAEAYESDPANDVLAVTRGLAAEHYEQAAAEAYESDPANDDALVVTPGLAAERCEQAAAALQQAAKHLHMTAARFRDHEIPRGCTHMVAALGHIASAEQLLKELAILHVSRNSI